MSSSANLMEKVKQWLGTLCCAAVCLLANPSHAQITPSFTLNQSVQGVAEFKLKRFSDLELQLPLPEGRWTVRAIVPVKSTHNPPIEGLGVFLERVVNQQVVATVWAAVYPQDNRNWSPGNSCFGSLLSKERGTSLSGYCHSLYGSGHMTNSSSEWQSAVRKSWNESGTRWPKQMLFFSNTSEVRGRFAVSTTYAIAFSATGLPIDADSSTDIRKKIEEWWTNNRQTDSVRSAIAWYESYSARVYEAVEGSRPSAVLVTDSPVPSLRQVAQDMTAALPEFALAAPPSAARPEPQAQVSAQRSSEAERERLAADLEASRKRQQELEEQLRVSQIAKREQEKLLAEQKAKDQQNLTELANLKQQQQFATQAEEARRRQQEFEGRLAQEAKERERLLAEARERDRPQSTRPTALRQERRVALVVGNAAYKNQPLANPVNDATDVASTLTGMGFETTLIRDATLAQMRNATRQFADAAASSDVALIFFAGHGIEAKGRNYVIPVGAEIKHEYELEDQAYDAGRWLDMLEGLKTGSRQRVNIVILDACRNNEFARSWRSSSRGLARMDAPTGTFVAFATAPGKVAADGARGQRNSPFTKSLLRAIQSPDTPIELMFKEVRRMVVEETNNEQVPWDNSSLVGDFAFRRTR
jgi:hypothetical protein